MGFHQSQRNNVKNMEKKSKTYKWIAETYVQPNLQTHFQKLDENHSNTLN